MKRQRIVAAWLACIMAAFVLPFAALAEGGGIAIKLDSGNAELAVGDYLSVNVKFDAAVASFGGAEFNVEYDSAKLEFVSYTPLIGSADEAGNGALNYHKKIRDGNIKILLLNAANIINKNSTGIANGTAIGNLVFKVTGENAGTASVKIAKEGFAACMPGDNTTALALTPADSTFTPTNVTVSDSVTYPTENAPTIYCLTSEKDGTVTLSLKANAEKVQRLDMQLTLNGYTDIAAASDCPFTVSIDGGSVTISHNAAPNTDGVDMRSGVAVLTMKKSGASQSITSAPKAIATKDANGALSPITQPNVTDDPYGGYALGDVNGDGKINTLDAMMTLRAAVGIESLDAIQTIRADIDANGKINTMDAMMILRRAVGLLDENYKNIY
ncbi:MAG: cohesin domain-containing protein [Christensenellaceae bacterium]|nr:cohesin domain-containing protein [Christensenellaceae bacterium]